MVELDDYLGEAVAELHDPAFQETLSADIQEKSRERIVRRVGASD